MTRRTASKALSLLLSLCMVLGMFPAMTMTAAAAGNDPKIVTINSSSQLYAGMTLQNNTIYKIMTNTTVTNTSVGQSGLKVANGASAVLYIAPGVTLTVRGGAGSGQTGGGAGIEIPTSSTLTITGGGTLNANGGKGGSAGSGSGSGAAKFTMQSRDREKSNAQYWVKFEGGNGGNGGNGGTGGNGGSGGSGIDTRIKGQLDQTGTWKNTTTEPQNGGNGSAGSAGGSMGALYIVGNVTVNATAGTNATSGGSPGSYLDKNSCNNNVPSGFDDSDYNSAVKFLIRFDVGGRENYNHTTFCVGQGGPGGGGGLDYATDKHGHENEPVQMGSVEGGSWGYVGHGGVTNGGQATDQYNGYGADHNGQNQDSDEVNGAEAPGSGGSGGSQGSKGGGGSLNVTTTAKVNYSYGSTGTENVRPPVAYRSIKLDDLGGYGGSTNAYVVYGADEGTNVAKPQRTGYNFMGYYDKEIKPGKLNEYGGATQYYDKNGAPANALKPAMVTSSLTLYAYWEPLKYNIEYRSNLDDGFGPRHVVSAENVTWGELTPLAERYIPDNLKKKNHTFIGWNIYDQQDWAMYYADKNYQVGLADTQGATAYLYAAWKENEKFTISYSANGGKGEPPSGQVYIHNDYTLSDSQPTRDGCTFAGWSTDPNARPGDSGIYAPSAVISDVQQGYMLYAVWKQNPSLTYHTNGGSFPTYVPTAYPQVGTQHTLTSSTPQRDGYTFAGWNTEQDGTGTQYNSGASFSMPDEDVVLYAKWTPERYTVTVEKPDEVTVDGVENSYDCGSTVSFSVSGGNGDVFVYANGKKLEKGPNGMYSFEIRYDSTVLVTTKAGYVVAYDPDGGSGMPVDVNVYTEGQSATVKTTPKPTKTGYTFDGWMDDGGNNVGGTITIGTSDVVLTAKWSPITYTVKFHRNNNNATGATPVTQTFTYDSEKDLKVADDAFTQTGKSVVGWASEPAGDVLYKNGATVKNLTSTQGGVIDLYAKWDTRVTKVNLDANGGSHGGNIGFVYVTYGEALTANLTAPTWDGYTFKGYYENADGTGRQYYDETLTPKGASWNVEKDEVTVYAKWEPISYSIHLFNGETQINYFSLENMSYEKDFTLPSGDELARSDSTFAAAYKQERDKNRYLAGWSSYPDSSYVVYEDQKAFTNGITTTDGATINLYAVFKDLETFTVTYNGNGGSGAPVDNTGHIAGNKVDVKFDVIPKRPGYEFLGWSTDVNATTPVYTQGETNSFTMEAKNVTLFAVWRAYGAYTVTYQTNTTDLVNGMPDDQVKAEDVDLKLSETIPSRAGYIFQGWSINPNAEAAEYAAGDTYAQNAALTLYAVWQAVGHTLSTYDNDVGSITVKRDGTELSSGAPLTYGDVLTVTVRPLPGYTTDSIIPLINGSQVAMTANNDKSEMSISHTVTGDTTITLLSNGDSGVVYKIVYNSNGSGQPAIEQDQSSGNPSALLGKVFTRPGWTLVGWSTASAGSADYNLGYLPIAALSDIPNTVVNLYAVWEREKITVTLSDAQQAEGNPGILYVTVGGTYEALPTLVKEGYRFDGWYTAADGGVRKDRHTEVTDTKDHTLHAHWTRLSFGLEVRANEALGTITETSAADIDGKYSYGSTVSFTVTPATGKTVEAVANGKPLNCITNADGKQSYSFQIKEDTVLYLISVEQKTPVYTVSYDANGGVGGVLNETFRLEGVNVLSYGKSISRQGYILLGWSTDRTATVAKYNLGQVLTAAPDGIGNGGSLKLYAVWKSNTCTITFDPESGTMPEGYDGSVTYTHGVAYGQLPEPTRMGWRFDGWYLDSGERVYATSTVPEEAERTLTARWTDERVTLSVKNSDLGTISGITDAAKYISGTHISFTVVPAAGKTIKVMANGTHLTEVNGAYSFNITENTTVYLVEIADESTPDVPAGNTYTVSYVTGGTGIVEEQRLPLNSLGALASGTALQKDQHTLIGWSKSKGATTPDFKLNEVLNGAPDGIAANDTLTLYPVWQKSTVTVTLNPDGGSLPTSVADTLNCQPDGYYPNLPTPTKEHCIFNGWYYSNSGSETPVDSNTKLQSDTDHQLTARWREIKYTVTTEDNSLGTISGLNADGYHSGDTVRFTVTAPVSGTLDGVCVQANGVTLALDGSGSGSFTITENTHLVLTGLPASAGMWYISYNANGGTGNCGPYNMYSDGTNRLDSGAGMSNGLNRLTSWNTKPDGTGTTYALNSTINGRPDGISEGDTLTLYAMWSSRSTITVTLDAQGGTLNAESSCVYDSGDTYGALPEPFMPSGIGKDYYFGGWYTDPSYTESSRVFETTVVRATDHTLYARWISLTDYVITATGYHAVYDGNSHALSVSVNKNGLTDLTYEWYKDGKAIPRATLKDYYVKNVTDSGVYTCVVKGRDAQGVNRTLTSSAATVTITQKVITVKATQTITYGDAVPTMAVIYSGLAAGDTESILNGRYGVRAQTEYTQYGDVGEYPITFIGTDGLNAANYSFSIDTANSKLKVMQKPVALAWTGTSFNYDGTEKTTTANITNKVNGDDVAVATYQNNAKTDKGAYVAKAMTLGGAKANNYTLIGATGVTHNWGIIDPQNPGGVVIPDDPKPVTGLRISPTSKTLTKAGDSFHVISTVIGTNQNVSYVSDNPAVATVDDDGTVTAAANGTTRIVVTTEEGGYQAVCVVTVYISGSGGSNPGGGSSGGGGGGSGTTTPGGTNGSSISAGGTGNTAYVGCKRDKNCPIAPFGDAFANAWYHNGVHYCIDNGLMCGYGNGMFGPNDKISRAQIVTILWRIAGSPTVNYSMNFTDILEGSWYGEAVRWATSVGVASGYGEGKFGPDDSITREQFAAMLYRFAKLQGKDTSMGDNNTLNGFTDVGEISGYAKTAMQWANGLEIISGTDNSTLMPKGNATRAQAACMIQRYIVNLAK